jgi:hypothetical protein
VALALALALAVGCGGGGTCTRVGGSEREKDEGLRIF